MTDQEYEFVLMDRVAKIKAIDEQYNLRENSYISFSGGKDSTVLHYLFDIALPNNNIPRLFLNTGVEYTSIMKFVKNMSLTDNRIKVVNSNVNIKKMQTEYGYPFKSKEHSQKMYEYKTLGYRCKSHLKYASCSGSFSAPQKLKYQFDDSFNLKISHLCCKILKKKVADEWAKKNKKKIDLTGMRSQEGGQRANIDCILVKNGKLKKFHPLLVVSDEWEEEFIKRNNITLCELYYPPFNFRRTGCKGCPFNTKLKDDLLKIKKYLPSEYKQCIHLWKPVYEEYSRIGYRLPKNFFIENKQTNIFDFIDE